MRSRPNSMKHVPVPLCVTGQHTRQHGNVVTKGQTITVDKKQ